jgi:hypothetical protein
MVTRCTDAISKILPLSLRWRPHREGIKQAFRDTIMPGRKHRDLEALLKEFQHVPLRSRSTATASPEPQIHLRVLRRRVVVKNTGQRLPHPTTHKHVGVVGRNFFALQQTSVLHCRFLAGRRCQKAPARQRPNRGSPSSGYRALMF